MEDSNYPLATSVFSGLIYNSNKWITFLRFFVFLLCSASFGILFLKFSTKWLIIYSAIASLVIVLIKFIQYILNKLLDHTFDVKTETVAERISESMNGKMSADDISAILDRFGWEQMDDEDVFQLITEGHPEDIVFSLYQAINSNITKRIDGRFISVCGKVVPFNISRLSLNAIFPMTDSIFYLFIGFIFIFLTYFLTGYNIDVFGSSFNGHIFILGGAVYAFLSPPEAEAYSLTKGDIMNGLTRLVFISLLLAINTVFKYFADNKRYVTLKFLEWSATFDFEKIRVFWESTIFNLILLTPLLINFIITSPKTLLHYIVECVDTYLFGCGMSARLSHSFLLLVRGLAAFFIVYFSQLNVRSSYQVPVTITLVSLVVQFPLSWTTQLKKGILSFLLYILSILCLTFLSAFFMRNINIYAVPLTFAIVSVFFDWLMPRFQSNNGYYFFHCRLFGFTSKILNILRIIVKGVTAPALICYALNETEAPKWAVSFFVVISITRSLCEPHTYSFALIIMLFTFKYEIMIKDRVLNGLLSLLISRKIMNVVSLGYFYKLFRPFDFEIETESFLDYVHEYFTYLYAQRVTFIDRELEIPAFLWSALTGCEIFAPNYITLFSLISSPRPSCFWDEAPPLEARTSFTVDEGEHPVEIPVYTSFAKSLTNSLNGLIKSGRLGVIDSGDILLFIQKDQTAFVEIISLDTDCVYFKVRGLEFKSETLCHTTETSRISLIITEYSLFPNVKNAFYEQRTNWSIRALGVPLNQYSVDKFVLQTLIQGVDLYDRRKWIINSFAYVFAKSKSFGKRDQPLTATNDFIKALRPYNIYPSPEEENDILQIIKTVIDLLYEKPSDFNKNFEELFLETSDMYTDESVNKELLENLITPGIKFSLSIISLASMQLAPELTETEELPSFFSEVDEDYISTNINSKEFETQFKREEKDIVTLTSDESGVHVLFFRKQIASWDVLIINKQSVRTGWQSDAMAQIFYQENDPERISIQSSHEMLHNLIIQSSDHPIGYPALISPVLASYDLPAGFQTF